MSARRSRSAVRVELRKSKGIAVIVERLLGSLIGTTFGLRGKRFGRAHGFLTGGPSSFLNTSTLLTAAGLAATAYTLYRAHQTATPVSTSTVSGGPQPFAVLGASPPLSSSLRSDTAPPPAPPSRVAPVAPPPLLSPATTLPSTPLPATPLPSTSGALAAEVAPVDALTRIVALALAAARCDGELGEEEFGRLIEVARAHKAEPLVARELSLSRPLADLARGVGDPAERADLYVLAYSIVRADESASPVERAWLAQWASLLGLDANAAARLEKDAAQRIAAATPVSV
jgi:uncharacterized membrane protein YebE (DUF533 family)